MESDLIVDTSNILARGDTKVFITLYLRELYIQMKNMRAELANLDSG